MYIFGSGVMTVTPAGSHPSPVNIGLLQEGSVSFKSTVKELHGQYQDPLAIGVGTRKWTGKAKTARISMNVLNALYFGGSITPGYTTTAYEAGAVPASSTYVVTVTHSADFVADQGVIYAATGLPLKNVASLTAAGQYTYAAGVYTFDSADASAAVVIAYNYTVSASGQQLIVPQRLIGPSLNFALNFTAVDPTNSGVFTGQFANCVATDANFLSTKLEDFVMPDFGFSLFVNAAGSIATFNTPDTF